jgi:hypothetical protein
MTRKLWREKAAEGTVQNCQKATRKSVYRDLRIKGKLQWS